jgi:hypothetical protein
MKYVVLVCILLLSTVFADVHPGSLEQAQKAKKEFEAKYLKQKPWSNYISSVQVLRDNNEFSLLVILAANPTPEDAPRFPQSFKGFKVVYKVERIVCPLDVKTCDDGNTTVSRKGPRCEFEECPKSSGHNLKKKLNIGIVVLIVVLAFSVFSCMLLCCCCLVSLARRSYRKQLEQHQTAEQPETMPLQDMTTPVTPSNSQQQQQPTVFYYQPTMPFYAQPMPFAENGLYPGYTPMMVVVPQAVSAGKQEGFTPMSDEEYARQLQAQFDQEARHAIN